MKTTHLLAAGLLATAAQAHAATYAIDPTHTFANFEVSHMGTSTLRGRFDRKEGQVQYDAAARTGRVEVSIDIASVSTGVPPLDRHLRGADFFDAEKFPQAKFVGDKFVFENGKPAQVSGTLTLRGKTLPLTLTATRFNCYLNPMLRRETCGGDFEALLERSQWGIDYGLDFGIPDQLRLLVQVEAIKQ
jgi:polyisoprenoid-binding protein YceI